MYTLRRRMTLAVLALFAMVALSEIALESFAEARAGGGRSGGFRGSRSYQAPSRPTQPTQPRREATPPPQQPSPVAPQPGGFMRGLGTAILGGFLGSMLFSGLAHGFGGLGGFGGSGFGLLEILLIAGLGYFLYRKFLRPAPASGYGTMQYQNTGYGGTPSYDIPSQYGSAPSAPPPEFPANDEPDFKTILAMDRNFDPSRFLKTAQDIFFKVQGAWNREDTATLNSLCGRELMQTWEEELASLRARGQRNRMDNIALSSTEITEAWTESGQDYITVRVRANLLDYTVDAKSGTVVSGSNSEPVEFEEYWTFSRPVGPNSWKLTAVQQA
jgi:predicted lipid-binding transport protein (Tim44 family)